MVDDLKRQASELYREHSEQKIPTSDSLSMKRVFYITIAIAAVALLGIYMFGGLKRRPDPVVAANTPPPLVKEAPPPELLEPPTQPPQAAQPETPPPKPGAPAEMRQRATDPAPAPPSRVETPKEPPPPATGQQESPATTLESRRPVLTRDTEPVGRTKPSTRKPAKQVQAPPPAAPEPPRLSEIEIARRELAREIVLEKNPALARLLSPNSKGWNAEPEGTDEYMVTFNIVDEGTGAPAQYVWRVNVSTRSTTPLSYYARRLS